MGSEIQFTVKPTTGKIPEAHSSRRGQYQDIVAEVLRSGEGRTLECKKVSDMEAVYAGIRRAIKRQKDPSKLSARMRKGDLSPAGLHHVYVELT